MKSIAKWLHVLLVFARKIAKSKYTRPKAKRRLLLWTPNVITSHLLLVLVLKVRRKKQWNFCEIHFTKKIFSICQIDLFVGYALEAKKTCKAKGQNASLILANENVLRTLNPYAYHKMINLEQDQEKFGKSPKINSIDVFYMDGMPILVVGVKEDKMIYYQKMSNGRSTVVSQNIEV